MLKGKVALITGASGGIGAATAQLLAKRGAIPVLAGRNEERLQEVADQIGMDCSVYTMDVGSSDQVQEVVTAITARYGQIDILVNNAGFGYFTLFNETTLAQFEGMMDTNYMGVVRCTQAVLPQMLARRTGHIVNVASLAGKFATAKASGYAASKHAVLGLTNALRMELRNSGVRVSAVNPGPVRTGFFEVADPEGSYVKSMERMLLEPEQVAQGIVRLISKGRSELDLPRVAGFGVKLYQCFPRWIDACFGGLFNRK